VGDRLHGNFDQNTVCPIRKKDQCTQLAKYQTTDKHPQDMECAN